MKRRYSSRPLGVLTCCAAMLALACNESATKPDPVAHVTLDLVVEPAYGSPEAGYVITATVINDGDIPVIYFSTSGCRYFTIVNGPDGEPVRVRSPAIGCTDEAPQHTLGPGEILRDTYPFSGLVYVNGVPTDALPGTYVVRAAFVWEVPGSGRGREERQQSFEWSQP